MIRNPFIPGIILIFLTAASHPAAGWTLDEAIERALDVSGTVAIEEFSADAASLDARDAASRWYPRVSLTVDASVVSKVMEIAMPQKTIRFGSR